jgi:hypothetical protein
VGSNPTLSAVKNKHWILEIIGVILLILIIRTIFSYVETNKEEGFFKTQNNFYQNNAYNFSINFPVGWKISPRDPDDSQETVQKAIKDGAVVSLAVRNIPPTSDVLSSENRTIIDVVEFGQFKQRTQADIEKTVSGVKNFEFGQTVVDQIPAYWVRYNRPGISGDASEEDTVKQYQIFYKNVLYIISTSANSKNFSATTKEFDNIITTFKIVK